MLKRLLVVGAIVAVGIGSAQARWLLGRELTPCSAWTHTHTTNAPGRLNMEDWVAGYLSSFNSLTDDPETSDFLKDEDLGWPYCIDRQLLRGPSSRTEKSGATC
jgi:hypothetical protein